MKSHLEDRIACRAGSYEKQRDVRSSQERTLSAMRALIMSSRVLNGRDRLRGRSGDFGEHGSPPVERLLRKPLCCLPFVGADPVRDMHVDHVTSHLEDRIACRAGSYEKQRDVRPSQERTLSAMRALIMSSRVLNGRDRLRGRSGDLGEHGSPTVGRLLRKPRRCCASERALPAMRMNIT
ncbi:MAG: hypothetical protein Q8O08_05630 [Methyloversatilis sp.]|uniref:hypothetical protein n=1 Tax=Methyloversatilis sp. TaxID=2569862 RepID=UPI00273741E6|nr:hypothetical protein [Methyloversatilis sp.]MDP2868287.1 hypothetical protein [Methyloversatilis sp.]